MRATLTILFERMLLLRRVRLFAPWDRENAAPELWQDRLGAGRVGAAQSGLVHSAVGGGSVSSGPRSVTSAHP
jgi:hypothetical protein